MIDVSVGHELQLQTMDGGVDSDVDDCFSYGDRSDRDGSDEICHDVLSGAPALAVLNDHTRTIRTSPKRLFRQLQVLRPETLYYGSRLPTTLLQNTKKRLWISILTRRFLVKGVWPCGSPMRPCLWPHQLSD